MKGRNWIQATGTVMLATMLLIHVIHLYSAWKRSGVPIVDASYAVCDALLEPGSFRESLNRQLRMAEQAVDGFTPVVYRANKVLNFSFAVRDEKMVDSVLSSLAKEINSLPADRVSCPSDCGVAADQIKTGGGKVEGRIHPFHATVRFLPWFKSLDVVVLLILAGALGVWVRKAQDE